LPEVPAVCERFIRLAKDRFGRIGTTLEPRRGDWPEMTGEQRSGRRREPAVDGGPHVRHLLLFAEAELVDPAPEIL
jgi:hypothetical protein